MADLKIEIKIDKIIIDGEFRACSNRFFRYVVRNAALDRCPEAYELIADHLLIRNKDIHGEFIDRLHFELNLQFKEGDKVTYFGNKYKGLEHGVVYRTPWDNEDFVPVVYSCAGNWDRFKEYTPARTDRKELRLGWTDKDIVKFRNDP